MKILAIRGKNLASLAGEFAVDFQAEPLAGAGLFAICGPTGAGKSTLLDALCLALYDDTPRLRGADSRGVELPDVGDGTTLPNDRRNLLRRGCSEGCAEVDFVGNDGVAYRARWSVRRARGKTGGKLQATEQALTRLADGQAVAGHTNREVQRAIVARIGLSFEQFTRAVLLAQNEFFAFLKTGEDERAALLQTLTGMDRFERISRRAFERNKSEQQKLASLRDRLADQQPLTAEARAAHEAERTQAKAALSEFEVRDKALAARLAWHEELERARAREMAAAATLADTQARREEAAGRRILLARIEAVQPARAVVAECDRLAAERERAARECAAAEAAVAAAETARTSAAQTRATAAAAVMAAEAAQARFAPAIAEARALDARIDTLAPQRARAAQALEEASAALVRARKDAADNAAARQARTAELEQAQAWLAAQAALAPLAEAWPRWDAHFAEATATHTRRRTAQAEIARLDAEARTRAESLETAATARTAAEARLQECVAASATADAAAQAFDLDALARRRADLETRRERLQAGTAAWRTLTDNRTQRDLLDAEAKALRSAVAAAEARLAESRAARPAADAAAAEAERAWRVVFEATGANVEALRARLEADAPCPVCGATEHPYVTAHPALDDALARLALHRDERRKAAEALAVAEQTLGNEVTVLTRQAGQLETRLAALAQAEAQLEDSWRQAAATLVQGGGSLSPADGASPTMALADAPPSDNTPDAVAPWIAALGEALAAARARLADEEARHREAAARQQATRKAMDTARAAADAALHTFAQRQSEAQQTASALHAAQATEADAAQRLTTVLAQLDGAHWADPGAWRSQWEADPAAWHAARGHEAATWLEHRAAATTLQAERDRLATAAEGLAGLAAQADARHAEAARALAELDAALEAKRAERIGVFAGMPLPPAPPGDGPLTAETVSAAEIESALAAALHAARDGEAREADALKTADGRFAAETATRAQHAARALALDAARESAAAALAAWIADFNARNPDAPTLDVVGLRALLTHGAEHVAAEREALHRLDTAVATATGALEQARSQRAAHESAGTEGAFIGDDAPADDPPALRSALAELAATLTAQREALGAVELALRRDDDIRHRSAELVQAIAAQEHAALVWARMNDLIGSADGKKFRNYAQQLTLDVLLAYANAHLKDLARRYRLERVPNSLALMVIDQDMGNERRSVHSLSGGESFLVSLALALGLASLSSHRVRVESLFIDEGFGSLDADTLRVAMDALDSLQAMGRKVGVISHVEEMTERIATRIRVHRLAGGESRVEVVG